MKISVLASGSKGNCSYIASNNTKILIDTGISAIKISRKLEEININPDNIDGILITHTHVDHINGLRVFIKKHHTKLYITQSIYEELKELMVIEDYEIVSKEFSVGDINVTIIKTSHDAPDANGFVLESNGKSIVYITDTGYINVKHHKLLINKNMYVMESNHDVQMLMDGKYPYHLKQRILGDKGHLSNDDSSKYLTKFVGDNTDKVILIHLSEDNNTEDLALQSLNNKLSKKKKNVSKIIISKQNERTELIEV